MERGMRILVVNPNTTAAMTARIGTTARAVAAPGTIIEAVTSPMGPESIEGYYDEAFAVPGLLRAMIAGARAGADGAVIACFDDTGLDACRTAVTIPVVGICEAALHLVAPLAHRFSIVTTLSRSIPPLEALVDRYGAARRCRVRAAEVPVLALEDRAGDAVARIEAEIARAIAEDRAEAIILGCAGMTDLAAELSAEFGLPVIDGVAAAVKLMEALIGLGLRTAKIGGYAAPLAKTYVGALAEFAPRAP
jgi:allantoin racemase